MNIEQTIIESVRDEYRTNMEKALITLLESKKDFIVRRESGKIFYDGVYIFIRGNICIITIAVDLATETIELYVAYQSYQSGIYVDDVYSDVWTEKFNCFEVSEIENLINQIK